VSDCDLAKGTIAVTKARVMARDKDRTKTSEDRIVQLCPRALEVLKRQLALRERWQRLGTRIDHEHVFFKDDGEPIRHLHYGWKHWRHRRTRDRPDRTGDPALTDALAPAWHQCRASDTTAGETTETGGGERGIRTLEGLLTLTPLAGVRLRPLGHLSDAPFADLGRLEV
jgi:hypothetical protein